MFFLKKKFNNPDYSHGQLNKLVLYKLKKKRLLDPNKMDPKPPKMSLKDTLR
jgi:hypothetical protein